MIIKPFWKYLVYRKSHDFRIIFTYNVKKQQKILFCKGIIFPITFLFNFKDSCRLYKMFSKPDICLNINEASLLPFVYMKI